MAFSKNLGYGNDTNRLPLSELIHYSGPSLVAATHATLLENPQYIHLSGRAGHHLMEGFLLKPFLPQRNTTDS